VDTPIIEIKTDYKLTRKVELAIISLSIIIAVILILTIPIVYAIAAFCIYLMTIAYGFYVLRSLNFYLAVYRDRLFIVQGTRQYNIKYSDIESIVVEPRVVSISLQPTMLPERISSITGSMTGKFRLPSIVSGTYIVRVRLRGIPNEIVLQLFKDEYELFVKALRKVRQLGVMLPEVTTY